MSSQSALSEEDKLFCSRVLQFINEYKISLRGLAEMVDCRELNFSKTSAHRLVTERLVPSALARARPYIIQAFKIHLAKRGFDNAAADAELLRILDNKEISIMLADRCLLSPEAVRFFGLKRDPFDVDHLPFGDEVFTNKEIDAAAARVRDAVMYQRFVAVVGGVGSGKTLLKLRVAGELADEGKSLLIYPEFFDMNEITVANIATQILAALDQRIPADKTKRVNRIKEVLTQMQQEGIAVAIIIDEAHRLHDRVISSFKNFWELTNGRNNRLLGVLLFGQPSFVESRLRDVKFKEIRQRVQVIEMPGLIKKNKDGRPDSSEAQSYLRHRIAIVGGDLHKLFDSESIKRICLNATTPLALGNLANEALMDAFELEEKKVTVSLPFFKKLNTGQQILGIRRSAA